MTPTTNNLQMRYRNMELERATFLANRRKLFAEHPHKWVLIYEDEIIGIFETRQDAISKGWELYPLQSIYTHQIEESETPIYLY